MTEPKPKSDQERRESNESWQKVAIEKVDNLHDWCAQLESGTATVLDGPIMKLRREIHRATAETIDDPRMPRECFICRGKLDDIEWSYGSHRKCEDRLKEGRRTT